MRLVPSYSENTDVLDQYLQNHEDDDDDWDEIEVDLEVSGPEQRKILKRKRETYNTIAVCEGTPPEWVR